MVRERLEPIAENSSLWELKEVSRVGSTETAVRCSALQMLIVGIERSQVCQALMVSDKSVRNWIKAFNERGADGLIVKKRPGRTVILKGQPAADLTDLIEHPEKVDRTFWTAKAFHGYISLEYQIDCSYQTVVRFFHRQGFSLKVPQPWPDRQDEEKRADFCHRLAALLEDEGVEIWFGDESGFEGDPRPRRRWDKKGAKTRMTKNGDHLRMNVIGMVCPRTGEFFAIEASHSDSDTFQAFLDEATKFVSFQRPKNILILDNAAWHKRKTTTWHGWQPMYLPPYSPDFNPIERLWMVMKATWFNNYHAKNVDDLIKRIDQALLDLIAHPEQVKKTAAIGTLL